MESIGEKLRATREEKSLSVDQVARDTNIAKRYIQALEEEAFSEFPGEPYLVGFLRNYSDYLGLDPEEIVGLYKNFKIQEQPVPIEELLERKRSPRRLLIFIGVIVAAGLIAAGVLFLPGFLSKRASPAAPEAASTPAGSEYQLKDEIVERRFVSGDTVIVPVGDKSYKVKLSVSGRDLVLDDAVGQQTIKLGEEKAIDLNGDGTPDLKVFLRDIDTQDPAHGVIVRFDRFTQSPNVPGGSQGTTTAARTPAQPAAPAAPAAASGPAVPSQGAVASAPAATAAQAPSPPQQTNQTPAAPQEAQSQNQVTQAEAAAQESAPQAPPQQSESQPAVGSGQVPQPAPPAAAVPTITPQTRNTGTGPVVIMQKASASPFTVNIDFTGYCLFRYSIDGQAEDQRYFQKGETTRIEARQGVEIWASNGGALNMTIGGNSVDLGSPGQIVVRKIQWVQDPDTGGYRLQMVRVQ